MLDPQTARKLALYGAIGFEVAGCVVLGILGGNFLDKKFASSPFGLLAGVVLGGIAAVVFLMRMTKLLEKDEEG